MEQQPDFTVKHRLPGRLRVILPQFPNAKGWAGRLRADLMEKKGVTQVQINSLCRSVTVIYDLAVTTEPQILGVLKDMGETLQTPTLRPSPVPITAPKAVKDRHGKSCTKKRGLKSFWNVSGTLFVGLGTVGAFVPLLPTVPLYLLAAFCYFRGSPGLYNRLMGTRSMGPLIRNYRAGNGLPARTKLKAILFMWASLGVSMVFLVSGLTLRMVLLVVGIGVTLHILRIKTYHAVRTPPKHQLPLPKKV